MIDILLVKFIWFLKIIIWKLIKVFILFQLHPIRIIHNFISINPGEFQISKKPLLIVYINPMIDQSATVFQQQSNETSNFSSNPSHHHNKSRVFNNFW